MPGLVMKRSHGEMEAGSRGSGPSLQNPESTDGETPRKKLMTESIVNGLHQPVSEGGAGQSLMANGSNPHLTKPDPSDKSFSADQRATNGILPEIESVPPDVYLPMDLLVERLAQNTFEILHDTIDELAEPPQTYINGISGTATPEVNTERKKKLWNFAHDSRAKFVKLLVLSQWSRNAESIAKVIDIHHYLIKQKSYYDQAHMWVGRLKPLLAFHNVPAPDLTATVRTLGEGKAEWISDLGYVPKPPLTAQEVLKELRKINTLLTIRLGLHQRPPERLRDYEIHDGRVTFKVRDEFELDLSIGSEDHSEQMYFLDFRFIFQPGGGRLRNDRIREEVERRVNYILRTNDLDAAYTFLHDLTLTHKLTVFRSQARKLTTSRWGDNVRPEVVHRALVLQYWMKRPGGKHQKNWIEIGIRKKCDPDRVLAGASDVPHLSIRWHRHGKEVLDHDLEVDPSEISLETILKDTLAAHTNFIFSRVKRDLLRRDNKISGRVFRITQRSSPMEPADCALEIAFPDGQVVTMIMEPVSGRLALMPPSNMHVHFENKLNSLLDPATQAADVIKQLRAATAAERSRRQIAMIGWAQIPIPRLGPQTLQASFHRKDVYRVQYCRPQHWDKSWCLALSHHTSGCEIWHLMKLKENPNAPLSREDILLGREKSPFLSAIVLCYDPSGGVEKDAMAISSVRVWNMQSDDVPRQAATTAPESSEDTSMSASRKYNFFFSLEAHGTAVISQITNSRQLDKYRKEQKLGSIFTLEHSNPGLDLKPVVPRDDNGPSTLHKTCVSGIKIGLWQPQLTGCYKKSVMTYVAGVYSGDGTMVTISHAELLQPLPMSTETLRFPGGAFQVDKLNPCRLAVQLNIKTGETVVAKLFDCLLGFSKMMTAADCLQRHSLVVKQIELGKIEVSLEGLDSYVVSRGDTLNSEQLRVTLSRRGSRPPTEIDTIEFGRRSPYARATAHWTQLLHESGLTLVASRLKQVHPLMATVAEISKQPLPIRPFIYHTDTKHLRLTWGYDGVNLFGLEAKLSRLSSNKVVWRIGLVKPPTQEGQEPPAMAAQLDESWKAELASKRSKGLVGVGGEVQVEPSEASTALWHVFDVLKPSIEKLYEASQEASVDNDETKKEGASQAETITIE